MPTRPPIPFIPSHCCLDKQLPSALNPPEPSHLRHLSLLQPARVNPQRCLPDSIRGRSRLLSCDIVLTCSLLRILPSMRLGLNNTVVLQLIGFSTGLTLYDTLYNNAVGNIILAACAGSIPGVLGCRLHHRHVRPQAASTLRVPRAHYYLLRAWILLLAPHRAGDAYAVRGRSALLQLGAQHDHIYRPGECFPTRISVNRSRPPRQPVAR